MKAKALLSAALTAAILLTMPACSGHVSNGFLKTPPRYQRPGTLCIRRRKCVEGLSLWDGRGRRRFESVGRSGGEAGGRLVPF